MGAGPGLTYYFTSSPALAAYFGPVQRVVGDGIDVERQWIHDPGPPPEGGGYAVWNEGWMADGDWG